MAVGIGATAALYARRHDVRSGRSAFHHYGRGQGPPGGALDRQWTPSGSESDTVGADRIGARHDLATNTFHTGSSSDSRS